MRVRGECARGTACGCNIDIGVTVFKTSARDSGADARSGRPGQTGGNLFTQELHHNSPVLHVDADLANAPAIVAGGWGEDERRVLVLGLGLLDGRVAREDKG